MKTFGGTLTPFKGAGYYSDAGDHLHPNDAGYQAMANAIPLWMRLDEGREPELEIRFQVSALGGAAGADAGSRWSGADGRGRIGRGRPRLRIASVAGRRSEP